jgi:predicted ATPase
MIIKLTGTFKSINTFESEELPPFCVITGRNGVGKTQLIQAIKGKYEIERRNTPQSLDYDISLTPFYNNAQFEGMKLSKISAVTENIWKEKIMVQINEFIKIPLGIKNLLDEIYRNGVTKDLIRVGSIDVNRYVDSNKDLHEYGKSLSIEIGRNLGFIRPGMKKEESTGIAWGEINIYFSQLRIPLTLAWATKENTKKDFKDLELNDFWNTPYDELDFENKYLFALPIEGLFYNYAKKRRANLLEHYRKTQYGTSNASMDDIAFVRINPKPWETINRILSENKINYSVQGIEDIDYSPEYIYDFKFRNTVTGKYVKFDELSSGEETIIGLILKLFISKNYSDKIEFPYCIFLDEPDAHLHPEMISMLINVLNETFVKQFKIKILITTHNPGTVALSPENSIFEMTNLPDTSLKKISKDDALKLLTTNLPLLSIDYKNHRQIFVESPTDAEYYRMIFSRHIQHFNVVHELYFVPLPYGKGSCDKLISLVSDLMKSGQKTVYGLIDFDGKFKSNSETHILVHGENSRYSIENFIYDPIILAILFLEYEWYNVHKELSLDKTYNQFDLILESDEKLQQVSDFFFDKVNSEFYKAYKKADYKTINYLSGKKINVPIWFLKEKGHNIFEKLQKVFKCLEKYSESELTAELTVLMVKSYPFIPIETIKMLEYLSTH